MTKRAFVLGVLILSSMALIQPWNDLYYQNTPFQGNHFPIGALFVLSLLVLVGNPLIHVLWPSRVLKSSELLSVWCMVIIGMSLPGSALLRFFPSLLVGIPYHASSDPSTAERVLSNLPDWILPTKNAASSIVMGYVKGNGGIVPWGAWVRPVLLWCIYFSGMYWMMFCLTTLFRKQWVENERLSFPLVQLPLEMCKRPAGGGAYPALFRNRSFWVGVSIPVAVHGINVVSILCGVKNPIPVPFVMSMDPYLAHIPGGAGIRIYVYFSVIAVAFLLTVRTTFSLWFFFIFFRVEKVLAASQGVEIAYINSNQLMGAYLVFTAAIIWRARKHLSYVMKKAITFSKSPDDSRELMSYPAAVWGLVVSVAVMSTWTYIAGNGGFLWAVISSVFWIPILLVVTRVVAQAGFLYINCPFAAPHKLLQDLGMVSKISMRQYSIAVFEGRCFLDIRETMMPNAMNNMKTSSVAHINPRSLLLASVAALIIAFTVASASQIKLAYWTGSLNWHDAWGSHVSSRRYIQHILARDSYQGPLHGVLPGLAIGAGITAFLAFMRGAFFWWPVAPIGMLFTGTYPLRMVWFSLLISWVLKICVLRYGGPRGYRTVRTACLGILMGDALSGGSSMFAGLIKGEYIYRVMPG